MKTIRDGASVRVANLGRGHEFPEKLNALATREHRCRHRRATGVRGRAFQTWIDPEWYVVYETVKGGEEVATRGVYHLTELTPEVERRPEESPASFEIQALHVWLSS